MVDDEAIVFVILEGGAVFDRPTASPLFDLTSMIASEPRLVLRPTLEIAMPQKNVVGNSANHGAGLEVRAGCPLL